MTNAEPEPDMELSIATATRRAQYAALCASIGTTIEADMTALLSIADEFLPSFATRVRDGYQPTEEFWVWCQGQLVHGQAEHDREISAE